MEYLRSIYGILLLILLSTLWRVFLFLVWRPIQLTRFFAKQGVHGPKYKFWSGNLADITRMRIAARKTRLDVDSHDIVAKNLPHYTQWISEYGATFLYWIGAEPVLGITDLEQIKQVLSNKTGFFIKTKQVLPAVGDLLGYGLFQIEGSDWSRHRRIITPAFAMDNLKMMTKSMAECPLSMLDTWKYQIEKSGENQATLEVRKQFQELLADVASHFALGGSLAEGKEVFLAEKQLLHLALTSKVYTNFPIFKYLPTKNNIQRWKVNRKMNRIIRSIIHCRLNDENVGYGNDLLGFLIEAKKKEEMDMEEIVEECKTFFLQVHETPSHVLSWVMFLLSMNLKWQEKLREEIVCECGMRVPNADNLIKLKQVRMVLWETLRLYPPASKIEREVVKDVTLGNLLVPKGMTVSLQTTMIQLNKEIWGDDVDKFNPTRFEDGVSRAAKHPNAMLAFSTGPRSCPAQNLFMLEATMIIALILQRFSFTLSPDYKHMPTYLIGMEARKGVQIVLKSIDI